MQLSDFVPGTFGLMTVLTFKITCSADNSHFTFLRMEFGFSRNAWTNDRTGLLPQRHMISPLDVKKPVEIVNFIIFLKDTLLILTPTSRKICLLKK